MRARCEQRGGDPKVKCCACAAKASTRGSTTGCTRWCMQQATKEEREKEREMTHKQMAINVEMLENMAYE